MTIGLIKRLLLFFNLAAVLVIAYAGFGFWQHRTTMQDRWNPPDFSVPTLRPSGSTIRIGEIGLQLGRFPQPEEEGAEVTEMVEETIESVIAQHGSIRSAIVVYGPYADGDPRPAIIFELKDDKSRRVLRLGEALENRDHPEWGKLRPIPTRYRFVGCRPHPQHEEWTLFLFDMACDGKNIQEALWKGDVESSSKIVTDKVPEGGRVGASGGFYIGREIGAEEIPDLSGHTGKQSPTNAAAGKEEGTDETGTQVEPETPTEPGETKPTTKPVEPETLEVEPGQINISEPLFEHDEKSDTFVPTSEGRKYLTDNYDQILRKTKTSTYRDPKTGKPAGVRIKRLPRSGVADQFGLFADDVILSINDRKVTKQSQAVNIVKAELKKKNVKIIRVKILRHGRTIEKRYDTRDANTRRKARDAFRNRR